MKFAGVLKQTGPVFATLAALASVCALHAYMLGDTKTLAGLALSSLISGIIWAILSLILTDTKTNADLPSRLGIVAIFWLVVPLLAAPAFLTSTVSNTWMAALFEAVSNLTTSGASTNNSTPPASIRLWRTLLQWLGGTASVTMAVAIFSDMSSSAAGLLRKQQPFAVGPFLLQRAAKRTGAVYLISASTATAILIANGTSPLTAFETAMAAVTTSNTLNTNETITGFIAPVALTLAMIVGASNIGLWSALTPTQGFWRDPELGLMLALILAAWIGTCWLYGQPDTALMAQTVSFMTGSGVNMNSTPPLTTILPAPVPEFLALAGGAALSTSGGLKLVRLGWLGTLVRDEFSVLAVEHSVSTTPATTKTDNDQALIYMMAYLLVIPVLLIGLCMTGTTLPDALRGAIGALTSHGPLMTQYLNNDSSTLSLCLMSIGCIAGRVELLALVPILGVIKSRFS